MIGNHAKTGIGTRLMAGSYIGFSSMLSSSGIAPRYVPSYTFLTDKGAEPYHLDKAIEVMKTVFAWRERQADDLDEAMMRTVAGLAKQVEA